MREVALRRKEVKDMKDVRYHYWVSNLNTDEGQYAANGEELDRLVQQAIFTGLEVQDVGVQLVARLDV
jgi:hypothetical protein